MSKRNLNAISWHWYAHGVTCMQGNEALPSGYRDTVGMLVRERGRDLVDDYDPARGSIPHSYHRRNASIGNSWRVAMRIKAKRAA